MTEREEKELRNYCAWLLKEYGFTFPPTDPVIPALYIMHRQQMLANKCNDGVLRKLEDIAKSVSPVIYQFNHRGEAIKFQLAKLYRWHCLIFIIALAGWGWFLVLKAKGDIVTAEAIISGSPQLVKNLVTRVRIDDEGFQFIEFSKPANGSIKFLTEYHQIDNTRVRIYLGKK